MGIYRTNNPMQYNQVDGIIIDERAPTPSIRGVGTDIAILVGQFNKGPRLALTDVTSREQLVEIFGDDSLGYNALVNKRFSRLRVIRVSQVDAIRSLKVFLGRGGEKVVVFTAIEGGVKGNGISVLIDNATSGHGKKYTITDGTTTEVYDLITQPILESSINGVSKLVTVVAKHPSGVPNSIVATNLTGGVERVIADKDYTDAIVVAEQQGAGNILFLDEYTSVRNAGLKNHAALAQDKIVICAGPTKEAVNDAVTAVNDLRDTDGRIIYAYNWVQTLIKGVPKFVSPASFVASILSNTSAHIDPAFVDNTGFLFGVSKLKQALARADYIKLSEKGICAFEYDPDIGFKLKSGVTTQIANSEKVPILRRRMTDFLTNSIGRYLKLYQNAPNTSQNREAVKGAILAFIQGQEELGILPKDTEVRDGDAKVVDVETLNTDKTVGEGKFFIQYKQRIYSSMRYIVLLAEIGQGVVVTEEDR